MKALSIIFVACLLLFLPQKESQKAGPGAARITVTSGFCITSDSPKTPSIDYPTYRETNRISTCKAKATLSLYVGPYLVATPSKSLHSAASDPAVGNGPAKKIVQEGDVVILASQEPGPLTSNVTFQELKEQSFNFRIYDAGKIGSTAVKIDDKTPFTDVNITGEQIWAALNKKIVQCSNEVILNALNYNHAVHGIDKPFCPRKK